MTVSASGAWSLQQMVGLVSRTDERIEGVWALDHGMTELRSLTDRRNRPLDADARDRLLALEVLDDGGRRWVPIAERDQPVFVLETPSDGPPVELPPALGAELRMARSRLDEIERTRRRQDMSVAAELQWSVLPVRADRTDRWAVGACLEPAYEVAGDLFDHTHGDGSLWVSALDGMGHGLDATLLGVIAMTALRNCRRRGGTLAEQFAAANRCVHERAGGDAFVTAIGCRFDHDGSVEIVNAGHAPTRAIDRGSARRLDLMPLLPLGIDPDTVYSSTRLDADEVADGLILASDGLEGSLGGPSTDAALRLDELIAAAWHDAPLVTVHRLVAETVTGHDDLDDDLTLVAVRSLRD